MDMLCRTGAVVVLLLWCSAVALNAAERQPKDVLGKNWVSVKLGSTLLDGDFYGTGPVVLLERLPDRRILLSYAELGNGAGKPPRAARHLSEAEFAGIVTQADAIWQKAQSDLSEGERVSKLPRKEQIEIRQKEPRDLSIHKMQIEFKASDPAERCVFEKAISSCSGAWFELLLKSAGVAPR